MKPVWPLVRLSMFSTWPTRLACICLLLAACSNEGEQPTITTKETATSAETNPPPAAAREHKGAPTSASNSSLTVQSLTQTKWQAIGQQTQAFADSCRSLERGIDGFLQQPSQDTLQQAQQLWHLSHSQLATASVAPGLAAASPNLFAALAQILSVVDTHPIAPGFIDSVEGYPVSGLVYDFSIPLNADTLLSQHGLTDASEATLGLHVIEFLLFGESGERSFEGYLQQNTPKDNMSIHQLPNNRRRMLLQLSTKLTCDWAATLAQQWQDSASEVTVAFQQLPPQSQLRLLRKATHLHVNELLTVNHCDFAPGCPLSGEAIGELLEWLVDDPSALNGSQLLPELATHTLLATWQNLQQNPNTADTEKQQHLKMLLQALVKNPGENGL